ncbi:ATP-binding protein [Flavobacterium sedimenticola]|uniref:ATP-grasp domain-containing protein n=1 Tax=Flavobacterium sedimenticola TaxID=3043286 RepID=A0ABT6XRH9_9FLAO|nr:hypothetical protein [Flavobacterium sedimenticola]MDI9257693.1 hypothetical protein [Flavobacterium sedimenticola]
MNILINGIGGPTPRSIAGAIRAKYKDAKLIGVDSNTKALGFYMQDLVDESIVIPRASSDDYWPTLLKIIEDYQIDFAFVQPEAEVTAWGIYFEQHGQYPCPVLIPPLVHVNYLMNKAKMADLLQGTPYIPKTVTLWQGTQDLSFIEHEIGYPCWIRASVGSGGLGSLKLNSVKELEAWLFIHKEVAEFTVSEFLTGRHLANQMLYLDGALIKNAGLHCAAYVMADIAPSKVTGNTSYGKFINETQLLEFCEEVMHFIEKQTGVKAHGVYSFDLKEDAEGNLKVTEINIRHMAYTGIMAQVGFDLIEDTIKFLSNRTSEIVKGRHYYDADYIFLRDVDSRPILLKETDLLSK